MLEQKIEALTAAVEALTAALLASQVNVEGASQSEEIKVQKTVISEPDPAPTGPSDQDVKDLTLARSREGHKDAIREALDTLGAKKIGDLKGGQVVEFYNWLTKLGSK
jgi:hypothetical protein